MSARLSARTRSWFGVGLAMGVVLPLVVATPASAQGVEPPDEELPAVECPEFDGEPAAEDEFTAYRYALACGFDVEVTSLRDVDRRVYATPEGLLDAQVAVQPYQVRDGSGQWVPVDPTLVVRADGSAASAATVIDIAVGAGGEAPFVTATDPGGGSLSLSWPDGGLPTPVVDGAVATYPEVLPDVDLAVQAEPVGFSWVLVVKSPEAASDPELSQIAIGIDTAGLSVVETETGIEVLDDAGEVVFEAGQAIMWDSSQAGDAEELSGFSVQSEAEEEPGDPGMIGEVEVDVTEAGIDLAPDAEMLADENLTYPLYIDPPFTSSRKAWANVYAGAKSRGWTGDSSWPRAGGMRVGRNTWPTCGDGCGLWRSVIRLNIGKLKGKYIHSARVHALQTHTGGCGSYGLQLWRTKAITNGVSWNDVSWLYGRQLDTKSPPSSNQTGNCGSDNSNEWVRFDSNVRKRVQSAAGQRYNTISFGLRSSQEGTRDAWRRIRTSSVKLHVTYYIYPPKPDRRKLNGQACRTSLSRADWVTSRHPTMSVRARSQESESVYVRLRVRRVDSSSNYYYYRTPDPVGAYSTVNRRVGRSLPDGEYTWQARSDSRHTSAVNSGYTSLCYFKVDATKPTRPTVSAPAGPFTEGQDVTLDVSSSDPLVNGVHSGLSRYEYSWNTPVYDRSVPPSVASVTRGDVAAGRHVLYVRSVDNAGNASDERVYAFFVGRDIPATPMGMWRFEGDLLDDSGHGNDLSLRTGSGPVFGTDHEGRAVAGLELDGGTCLRGQAPVRTDAAFSVALWVRMDAEPEGYTKVLAQGAAHSAYQIQYSAGADEWYFSTLSEDYNWYTVGAANPATLGEWLHVAGTYDPDAGLSRIYLNGELAGERTVDFEPWNGTDFFSVGCLRTGHRLTGAIDGLGAWQGLLTQSQIRNAMVDLPGAAELARWEFRDGGQDSSRYGRDLAIPDHIEAGEDRYHRPNGAVELDGETCLEYPEALDPSDRSWSIATWVKLDSLDGETALVSTYDDAHESGFVLAATDRGSKFPGDYRFRVAHFTSSGPTTTAGQPFGDYVEPGRWYHVAVSVTLESHEEYGSIPRWRYYIDGVLVRTIALASDLLPSGGPLRIGCSNYSDYPDLRRGLYLDGSLQDVRLWRGAIGADDVAAMVGNPPAELGARWRLEGRGDDTSGRGHNLTFEGGTQIWDGWSCDPDSALELSGSGAAATDGPVVATDESFTVSAWGRIDTLTDHATFVAAAGQQQTGFRLQYNGTYQQFQFVMTSGDVPSSTDGFQWSIARGGPVPEVDTWYHLVGVFDLVAGEIHLYVNGELLATGTGPDSPWYADGPLVLGASATADGNRWNRLYGAVDDVVVWQGVVPEQAIGQMSPGTPVEIC